MYTGRFQWWKWTESQLLVALSFRIILNVFLFLMLFVCWFKWGRYGSGGLLFGSSTKNEEMNWNSFEQMTPLLKISPDNVGKPDSVSSSYIRYM